VTDGTSRPRPTDAELELLQELWTAGPSTVRVLQQRLGERRDVGYTTVLKLLQIMHEKGLVERREAGRAHVYRAAEPRADVQGRLVRHLLDRAFGGSAAALAVRALEQDDAGDAELAALRELLAKHPPGEGA
jgi:predicted transcriptional regulator